jgi:hypothetical protein
MAASDVKGADAMADQCIASRYEECGLTFYAAR